MTFAVRPPGRRRARFRPRVALRLALAAGLAALPPGAFAASKPRPPAPAPAASAKPAPANAPLLPGTTSKEPINIDAGKLDYFDKDQKLVYTGDVVAAQGESTLKASVLTIFLQKDAAAPGAPPPAAPAAPGSGGSSVSHMEADGPVTLISKDQVGTGDHGTYDKAKNTVTLTGSVTLSQGTNVTQGDRLVYDMTSGQAQVFSGHSDGRVHSVFTPGSGAPPGGGAGQAQAAPKPAKGGSAPKRKAAKAAPEASGGTAAEQREGASGQP